MAEVAIAADTTLYDASYVALAHATGATAYTAHSYLLDGSNYADLVTHVRSYAG